MFTSVGHCAGRGDSLLDLNRPLDAEGNPVYVFSGSGGRPPGVTPTRGVATPGTSEAGPSASIPVPEDTLDLDTLRRYGDLYMGCAGKIHIIWDSALDQDRLLPTYSTRSKTVQEVFRAHLYVYLSRTFRQAPLFKRDRAVKE
jgi:hypothetical protein